MLGAGQKKFGADWERFSSRLRQDGSRQGKGGTPHEKSPLCTLNEYCIYLSMFEASLEKLE